MKTASVGTGAAVRPLIRFDRKTRTFLGLLILALAVGTAFKLHGSSIGYWNQVIPGRPIGAGILAGTPKLIRIDEWSVTTPAMVSQAKCHPAFPVSNPGWGPACVPLTFNLPSRHWSMLVRPQYWGFFVLDLERGFAFYWNMKAALLLGGVFLLLMILTGSDFWVSMLGTAWVFFSGFMQWWYSSPAMLPETVGCVALLLVAAHYLLLSTRAWVIGGAAVVFSVCLLDATLSLYPPFQVPLLYLGVAILAGSCVPRLVAQKPRTHLALRIACVTFALLACATLLALYYRDARSTVDLIRGTVYPGARVATGGDISLAQIFGGFFGFFMSEANYPRAWQNVCEASNFTLLFPVPLAVLAWRAWHKRSVTAIEWSLAAYLAVALSWMTLGWPRFLALASGLSLSQGSRSLLGLGLGSILLCCVFLAANRVDVPRPAGRQFLIAAAMAGIAVAFALDFAHVTRGFATPAQVAFVSLGVAAAGYLLLARRRRLFAAVVLVPAVWSHALVNPVATGLGPILDQAFLPQVSRLVERDPQARWTVYGSYVVADLIKATGADVFNGTKVVPPLDDLTLIDPASSDASVYNRYAHVTLAPTGGPEVHFELENPDSYTIRIDPNSDLWRRLGIRYVALPFPAKNREFLGRTTLVTELPDIGMWVYRYL